MPRRALRRSWRNEGLRHTGLRPVNGEHSVLDRDAAWSEHMTFNQYIHGETGAGMGTSQQTGWTALVAKLISQSGR